MNYGSFIPSEYANEERTNQNKKKGKTIVSSSITQSRITKLVRPNTPPPLRNANGISKSETKFQPEKPAMLQLQSAEKQSSRQTESSITGRRRFLPGGW